MIAAVFDCMVFLQAATNDQGPAFACLELVESNQVRLYLSPPILAEVRDVLTRPKVKARFPHLTPEYVDIFVQKLVTTAALLPSVSDAGVSVRDPDDLPYLNLAIAANAGYIVSRDADLLDLMNDASFTSNHPHIRILDPVAFLKIVRATQPP